MEWYNDADLRFYFHKIVALKIEYPMDHFKKIYASQAKEYHRMISPEDVDGNLFSALTAVASMEGARLLDLGTGTGRIPLMVHDLVDQVVGLDLNFAMLQEQQSQKEQINKDWPLIHGDNRRLPIATGWATIVTAGWAIGHLRAWFEQDWKTQIGKILTEMERTAKPDGLLIIMETLTTGALEPAPPTSDLAEYYNWLEEEWGYLRNTIQTDYQFKSVDEAIKLSEFFFGPELSEKIKANNWVRLPEWTGVWSKRI